VKGTLFVYSIASPTPITPGWSTSGKKMKISVTGISMFITPLWVNSSEDTAFLDIPLRKMLYLDFITLIAKKLYYFNLN
jgi:hypothetical protein